MSRTFQPLTPGWAIGLAVTVHPEHLQPSPTHHFPPHTRLGLLERLHPPPSTAPTASPHPTPPPWSGQIAVLHTPLTVQHVLALSTHGAVGVILTAATPTHPPADRHALIAARATGLPVAWAPGWQAPEPAAWVHLNTTTQHASIHPHSNTPPWPLPTIPRVLPIGLASQSPARPWLELITGQAEERAQAVRMLDAGRARGVGLLRLEFLIYATPNLDAQGLCAQLTELLTDLRRYPVAIRLTDWSTDKPPPTKGPLSPWNGSRGLDGIVGTSSIRLQWEALLDAQAASGHAQLHIIAPHVGRLEHVQMWARRIQGHARFIAMLESPQALDQATEYAAEVDGIWLGLGDLGRAFGGRLDVLRRTLDRIVDALEGTVEVALCGDLSAEGTSVRQ